MLKKRLFNQKGIAPNNELMIIVGIIGILFVALYPHSGEFIEEHKKMEEKYGKYTALEYHRSTERYYEVTVEIKETQKKYKLEFNEKGEIIHEEEIKEKRRP